MATQGQFVHRPGAFIPVRERLLTGVSEPSRERRLAVADVGRSSGSAASQFEPDAGKAFRSLAAVADTRWGLGGHRHPGTACREGESDAPGGRGRDGAVFGEAGGAEGVVGVSGEAVRVDSPPASCRLQSTSKCFSERFRPASFVCRHEACGSRRHCRRCKRLPGQHEGMECNTRPGPTRKRRSRDAWPAQRFNANWRKSWPSSRAGLLTPRTPMTCGQSWSTLQEPDSGSTRSTISATHNCPSSSERSCARSVLRRRISPVCRTQSGGVYGQSPPWEQGAMQGDAM